MPSCFSILTYNKTVMLKLLVISKRVSQSLVNDSEVSYSAWEWTQNSHVISYHPRYDQPRTQVLGGQVENTTPTKSLGTLKATVWHDKPVMVSRVVISPSWHRCPWHGYQTWWSAPLLCCDTPPAPLLGRSALLTPAERDEQSTSNFEAHTLLLASVPGYGYGITFTVFTITVWWLSPGFFLALSLMEGFNYYQVLVRGWKNREKRTWYTLYAQERTKASRGYVGGSRNWSLGLVNQEAGQWPPTWLWLSMHYAVHLTGLIIIPRIVYYYYHD